MKTPNNFGQGQGGADLPKLEKLLNDIAVDIKNVMTSLATINGTLVGKELITAQEATDNVAAIQFRLHQASDE